MEIDKNISIIANKYIDVLKNKMNIKEVYLFGSYAVGKQNNDSDIDIAVISDDFSGNVISDMHSLMKLRRNVDLRIEPHPFLSADFNNSNPFANEIMNSGIKIL